MRSDCRILPGYSLITGDCVDTNRDVFPNQLRFIADGYCLPPFVGCTTSTGAPGCMLFGSPRGCNLTRQFDYNCDGVVDRDRNTSATCSANPITCNFCTGYWVTYAADAPCGTPVTRYDCNCRSSSCFVDSTSAPLGCR